MCIISLSVLGGVLGTTFAAIGSALGVGAGAAAGTAVAAGSAASIAAGTASVAAVTAAANAAALAASTTAATVAGVGVTVAADLAITGALVGGTLATIGAVQQAEQQEAMAEFYAKQEAENARLAHREAEAIEVMGNQERNKLRLQMLDQRSAARTGYAASGVVLGSGSVLDYEADIADAYDLDSRNLEYDIESRKWQKKVAATNATSQSMMYKSQATGFSRQKTLSLLSGTFNTIKDTTTATLGAAGSLKKLVGA